MERAKLQRWLLRQGWRTALAALLVVLPFGLLVRGSLWGLSLGLGAWPALALGVLLAAAAVAVPAALVWRRLTGDHRLREIATRVALPVVLGFAVYGVAHLSSANAKDEQVRSLYVRLHPVLRLGVATARLADPELVVTDAARQPGDYARMGLPVRARSRHFEQADGWVHAVDLRTRGRSGLRNVSLRALLWGLGFDTLRHGGTADHLHVTLPAPRP